MTPYKTSALRYWAHGWQGPLPVGTKPNQKTAPPAGHTGNDGVWPTEEQIIEWTQTRAETNIALRLPPNIIGIDVDDYDNKPGAATMIAVTETHGLLPRTWISTSREGNSGIRWYRLANPQVLPGKLVHPDNPDMSGVEIIQHTHRYAVVPPSVHPTGNQYRWITPDKTTITDGTLPQPGDFPEIPQSWVDHILQDCSCYAPYNWGKYEQQSNDPVKTAYQKWANKMTDAYGRHDAALGGVMALVAFKERGWPGAAHHLEQLQNDFLVSLGDTRTGAEAEAEWERMVEGATKKAVTTTIPVWQPQNTTVPPPETFNVRVEAELDTLRVRDTAKRKFAQEANPPRELPPMLTLEERLANPLPPVAWRIEGWQPIGTRVLLAAQYKAGKTTLTGNLARSLVDNQPWLTVSPVTPVIKGHVTILDFEMSERQIDSWLSDQGIDNKRKVVVIPLRGSASVFDILDDRTRKEWATRLQGTEYVILDCLRPILDSLGLDEHREAGRFLTAFDELCSLAGISDSLVVHHMGHTGERSRGDSRLRDWPDVEWRLVRENEEPDSPRYISAYGRDVDQSEGLIHHDTGTRHLTFQGGSRTTAAARGAIPDLLEYIKDNPGAPKTGAEAALKTEHGQKVVRDAIKIAVTDGLLIQESGRGHYLYLPPNSSARRTSSDELTSSSAPIGADELIQAFEGAEFVSDQTKKDTP